MTNKVTFSNFKKITEKIARLLVQFAYQHSTSAQAICHHPTRNPGEAGTDYCSDTYPSNKPAASCTRAASRIYHWVYKSIERRIKRTHFEKQDDFSLKNCTENFGCPTAPLIGAAMRSDTSRYSGKRSGKLLSLRWKNRTWTRCETC